MLQKVFLLTLLLSIALSAPMTVLASGDFSNSGEPGAVLVKFINEAAAVWPTGVVTSKEKLFASVYRAQVTDTSQAVEILSQDPNVVYVESDRQVDVELIPIDSYFTSNPDDFVNQWYLPKLKVPDAWNVTNGARVKVAVVDTGIDGRHEDLNDGRVKAGFESYCETPDPRNSDNCLLRLSGSIAPGVNSDDNGHGTIVAGILGATPNNRKGIAGIGYNVDLIPVKILNSAGSGFASDVAVGIVWAADNGAKVINVSLGGQELGGQAVLYDAAKYAFDKGAVVIAAAGNDSAVVGLSLNEKPVLPVCADDKENVIIGVAAVDKDDKKAKFSNYGSECVDISAPGAATFIDFDTKQGILSTFYDPSSPSENDLYAYALGTSVAAPMVSGAASLIYSAFPDLDAAGVRDRLIASVDNIDDQNLEGCQGSCVGQLGRGRLNVLKAVQAFSTLDNGVLAQGSNGQLYFIEQGLKYPVSSFVAKQRFDGAPIMTLSDSQLGSLSIGEQLPPIDGTLIKEESSPIVYEIEDGQRRPLSLLAFSSRAVGFDQIVTISADEIIKYPVGDNAQILDGALMKPIGSPAVYVLDHGVRRLVSYFGFLQYGFDKRIIAELPVDKIGQYSKEPSGFLYALRDGTLLRSQSDPTVFVFESGKMRALSGAAFSARGYSFSKVNVLSDDEIRYYEKGQDIL